MKRSILVALLFTLPLAWSLLRHERTSAAPVPSPPVPVATGTLHGRVLYQGTVSKPQKLSVVKDVAVCGKREHLDERLVVGANQGIKHAVVSLMNVKATPPAAALHGNFVLDQQGCSYQPHVVLVPVGTPVQVLNSDEVLHNIHTFSKLNPPVNLAQPRFKKKLELRFEVPERISVRCDVHGWMSAWIVAVDHPFHAVTDAEGNFTLTGIPAGTYTVTCWQETLGEQTAQVTITPGGQGRLDFKYAAINN